MSRATRASSTDGFTLLTMSERGEDEWKCLGFVVVVLFLLLEAHAANSQTDVGP